MATSCEFNFYQNSEKCSSNLIELLTFIIVPGEIVRDPSGTIAPVNM
jgi:hypothetical protein